MNPRYAGGITTCPDIIPASSRLQIDSHRTSRRLMAGWIIRLNWISDGQPGPQAAALARTLGCRSIQFFEATTRSASLLDQCGAAVGRRCFFKTRGRLAPLHRRTSQGLGASGRRCCSALSTLHPESRAAVASRRARQAAPTVSVRLVTCVGATVRTSVQIRPLGGTALGQDQDQISFNALFATSPCRHKRWLGFCDTMGRFHLWQTAGCDDFGAGTQFLRRMRSLGR